MDSKKSGIISDKRNLVLTGERVVLRSLNDNDISLLRRWRNQEEIRCNFLDPSVISEDQQQQWWKKYRDKDDDYMFLIFEKKSEIPVGTAAVYNIIIGQSAEYGRMMIGDKEALSRGYGVDATRILMQFAFRQWNLQTIRLQVLEHNSRAIRLYEKVGFSKTGSEPPIVEMCIHRDIFLQKEGAERGNSVIHS